MPLLIDTPLMMPLLRYATDWPLHYALPAADALPMFRFTRFRFRRHITIAVIAATLLLLPRDGCRHFRRCHYDSRLFSLMIFVAAAAMLPLIISLADAPILPLRRYYAADAYITPIAAAMMMRQMRR